MLDETDRIFVRIILLLIISMPLTKLILTFPFLRTITIILATLAPSINHYLNKRKRKLTNVTPPRTNSQ